MRAHQLEPRPSSLKILKGPTAVLAEQQAIMQILLSPPFPLQHCLSFTTNTQLNYSLAEMLRACADNKVPSLLLHRSSLGRGSGWLVWYNMRIGMTRLSTSSFLQLLCPCCWSLPSLSTATGKFNNVSVFKLYFWSRDLIEMYIISASWQLNLAYGW